MIALAGSSVVVTGGSRGLGLGIVEALVQRGARLTVVARDTSSLAAVQQRLGVATIAGDVTDPGLCDRVLWHRWTSTAGSLFRQPGNTT